MNTSQIKFQHHIQNIWKSFRRIFKPESEKASDLFIFFFFLTRGDCTGRRTSKVSPVYSKITILVRFQQKEHARAKFWIPFGWEKNTFFSSSAQMYLNLDSEIEH